MQLLFSAVMFALGVFGSALLLLASAEIARRFGIRRQKMPEPVLVDVAALIVDRIVLNLCMTICLLLECGTLVWDSIDPNHFPIWVRWPLDVLVVIGVTFSGIRLFRLYLDVSHAQKLKQSGDGSDGS